MKKRLQDLTAKGTEKAQRAQRIIFKFICGCLPILILISCSSPSPPIAPERPNILFIMADDHTAQAFGLYGHFLDSFVQTHHIQRIAQEGMRLDRVYCTNSICVPSRAAILTGTYSHVNQVYTLSDRLDPEMDHVAKHFQQGGYQTAIVGKWHLKTEPQGFDYYQVLPGQGKYQNPVLKEKGKPWEDGNKGGEAYEGYSADVITDQTLNWLEQRNTDKPFLLFCHFKAVHEPFDFAKRYQDLYTDTEFPLPPSLFEDRSHRSPATQENGMFMTDLRDRYVNRAPRYPKPSLEAQEMEEREQIIATYQKFVGDYLRGVASINDNVGRLLDYLDQHNLDENTVVIYTSDQGYFLGEHGYIDKRMMYEESARMPFVVRYPKEIEPGSTNQDLILNVDFAPTFLDYAGLSIPNEMQGRSFRNNLQGQTPTDWRTSFYYRYWLQERRPAHFGIRTARYKLIFFYSMGLGKTGTGEDSAPGWEFYDLAKDPLELKNVYGLPEYMEVIDSLKQEMMSWKQQLGDTDEAYPAVQEIWEGLKD